MKPVSTGTGLCALAGAVLLYPLLHRAAPQAGALNAASAESPLKADVNTRAGSIPTPHWHPALHGRSTSLSAATHLATSVGETAAALAVGDCEAFTVAGEPLNWFTAVHLMESECQDQKQSGFFLHWRYTSFWNFASTQNAVDVDRDGVTDELCFLAGVGPYTSGGENYEGYRYMEAGRLGFGQLALSQVVRWHYTPTSGGMSLMCQPVITGDALRAAICLAMGCPESCDCVPEEFYLNLAALRDMDSDGDHDLVVAYYASVGEPAFFWMENTVPSNPPLAADINEDGYVDGKDLAMVLSAWSQ